MLADFGVPNRGKHHLRIHGAQPVPSSGAHRQGALASLPESRKFSGPYPIAKPQVGFAHLRAEKIRAKKLKGKSAQKMDRLASDPAPLLCDGSPLATG
jgi:hypothetical protein